MNAPQNAAHAPGKALQSRAEIAAELAPLNQTGRALMAALTACETSEEKLDVLASLARHQTRVNDVLGELARLHEREGR